MGIEIKRQGVRTNDVFAIEIDPDDRPFPRVPCSRPRSVSIRYSNQREWRTLDSASAAVGFLPIRYRNSPPTRVPPELENRSLRQPRSQTTASR